MGHFFRYWLEDCANCMPAYKARNLIRPRSSLYSSKAHPAHGAELPNRDKSAINTLSTKIQKVKNCWGAGPGFYLFHNKAPQDRHVLAENGILATCFRWTLYQRAILHTLVKCQTAKLQDITCRQNFCLVHWANCWGIELKVRQDISCWGHHFWRNWTRILSILYLRTLRETHFGQEWNPFHLHHRQALSKRTI